MKILYAGSPLASAIVLKTLIDNAAKCGFEIAGVLTNPPSARGRHHDLIPTDVSRVASENGIKVFEFDHLLADAREAVETLGCDLLVSFDYGRIFGPKFLALFAMGGINLHPSALPLYRGCTPVPACILNGDSRLGITVQKLALKTDEGDILGQVFADLDGTETTLSLMDGDGTKSVVTEKGGQLLVEVLAKLAQICKEGSREIDFAVPQKGDSSYTPFLSKEDGIINFAESAQIIDRKVRAFTPWPLCSCDFNGTKLTILKTAVSSEKTDQAAGTVLPYRKNIGIEIACGEGSVLIATELQLQGKKTMDYKSFLNGARNFAGAVLK